MSTPPEEIEKQNIPLPANDDEDLQDVNEDALFAAMEASEENPPPFLAEEEDEMLFDISLSPLEKIFLFAKSDLLIHRVFIAKELPQLIPKVDISEAVEYIIPLINNIATDPDESVRQAFAPELGKIIWHYYKHCPLKEVRDSRRSRSRSPPHMQHIVPETEPLQPDNQSHLQSQAPSSLPPSTPPPSSLSSPPQHPIDSTFSPPQQDPDRQPNRAPPSIHASIFTPIFHALLLDNDDVVTQAAQDVLINLIKDLNASRSDESSMEVDGDQNAELKVLSQEALEGVVIGIGSLLVDEREDQSFMYHDDRSRLDLEYGNGSQPRSPSPPSQGLHSDLLPEKHSDEVVNIGKTIMLALISRLSEVIDEDHVQRHFLPQILRLYKDMNFVVRRTAAVAMGPVAKRISDAIITSEILPAYEALCEDSIWHVRKACCMTLASICSKLPTQERRARAVKSIDGFSTDISRSVQLAVGEALGEVIYTFKDDADGPPQELLDHYVRLAGIPSQTMESLSEHNPDTEDYVSWGSPSMSNGMGMDAEQGISLHGLGSDRNAMDPERPVLCAFNLPAVTLTLGPSKWDAVLRPVFLHLSKHADDKIRRSIAASLHELAKILGPEITKRDLESVFSRFLSENNSIVRTPLFMHFAEFIACLPKDDEADECLNMDLEDRPISPVPSMNSSSASSTSTITTVTGQPEPALKRHIQKLREIWESLEGDWRSRCDLASQIGKMAEVVGPNLASRELLACAMTGVQDPVSAVREASVAGVASLLKVVRSSATGLEIVRAQLKRLATNPGYRSRVTFVQICLATLEQTDGDNGFARRDFESDLLPLMNALGSDRVINVRIGVARVVKRMCDGETALFSTPVRSPALTDLIYRLARDTDTDVRNFVSDLLYSSSPTISHANGGTTRDYSASGSSTRQSSGDDSLHGDGPIATSTTTTPTRWNSSRDMPREGFSLLLGPEDEGEDPFEDSAMIEDDEDEEDELPMQAREVPKAASQIQTRTSKSVARDLDIAASNALSPHSHEHPDTPIPRHLDLPPEGKPVSSGPVPAPATPKVIQPSLVSPFHPDLPTPVNSDSLRTPIVFSAPPRRRKSDVGDVGMGSSPEEGSVVATSGDPEDYVKISKEGNVEDEVPTPASPIATSVLDAIDMGTSTEEAKAATTTKRRVHKAEEGTLE